MIWRHGRQIAPAAETCCPTVNFFCCKEYLEEWTKENPDLNGKKVKSSKPSRGLRRVGKSISKHLDSDNWLYF
jgi:hypothetical protein